MSNLSVVPFRFESQEVRTVIKDGVPWFVAKDIAEILGYSNPQKAVRDHCKTVIPVGVNGSFTLDPQTIIIPERDVYRLVMRSKLPTAEKFEEWVVGEVLPSIRKTGKYEAVPQYDIPPTYAAALRLAADQQEQIENQQKQLEVAAPKVEAFDTFMDAEGTQSVGQVAKVFDDMGEHRLFRLLRNENIFMSNNMPYQKYVNCGYFEVIEKSFQRGNSTTMYAQTRVTSKGVEFIRRTIQRINGRLRAALKFEQTTNIESLA